MAKRITGPSDDPRALTGAAPRLHERSFEILAARITSGALPAGTKLLESHLAREFGISRAPARQALARLAALGLVRRSEGHGYRVTSFTSSEEALSAFRHEPESFHAIITDHTMPRLTGVDLARKVKSLRADIPIILTTGYGDGISSAPAGSDVDAVAGKPLDAASLTQTLRRLIAAE